MNRSDVLQPVTGGLLQDKQVKGTETDPMHKIPDSLNTDRAEALLRSIIKYWIVELTGCGGTNPDATCDYIAEEEPDLFNALGDERVLELCEEIHRSEDTAASGWYAVRLHQFNKEYFGGRLGDYRVRVVYEVDFWITEPLDELQRSHIDLVKREIILGLIAFTAAVQRMVIEAAATGPWCLRTYLEVTAATGCRRGEVLALRWSDIQDGRAMVARSLSQTRAGLTFKSTKTEEPRPVSLPVSAIAALEEHRKCQDEFRRQYGPEYRADLDLIFANPDGSPFKPDSISAAVSLLFRRLKLPKGASLHSLRHSHCSHLQASGVPLPAVSARLGHGSIRTTQEIYSHMIHGQDDEAARKWEEFQNQPTGGEPQQKGRVQ